MLTSHALPPGRPILVGPLTSHRLGPIKGRPMLICEPWCPWCRDRHPVPWPDAPAPPGALQPLRAPCPSGPLAGEEVMVGLDDARRPENARMIRHHAQALRRWRVEQRLRGQLSESRALDRAHRREWPDAAGATV